MNLIRCCACAAGVLLAGCATTGNPRAGGLFGWSEAKAQTRQQEKRTAVAQAAAQLAREMARRETLETRNAATAQQIASNRAAQQQALDGLLQQLSRTLTNARQLEADSPTSASASRARQFQRTATAVANDQKLSVGERVADLQKIDAKIAAVRAQGE